MQDTRRPPELSPDSPEIEKSLREELFALRVAHESALADLRAKDERIHELEYDFAVVHTKYENAKDYLKRLLWNELPPDVAGLRPLRELATMEHMPPPPGVAGDATGERGSIGRFAIGRVIGKGGLATVYAARDLTAGAATRGADEVADMAARPRAGASQYAVKVVDKSRALQLRAVKRLALEVEIGRSLHHPNVYRLEDAFASPTHVRLATFTPLARSRAVSAGVALVDSACDAALCSRT